MKYLVISMITLIFLPTFARLYGSPLVLEPLLDGLDLSKGAVAWIDRPTLDLHDPCMDETNCSAIEDREIDLVNGFGGPNFEKKSLYLRKKVYNPYATDMNFILTHEWATVTNLYLALHSSGKSMIRHSNIDTPILDRDYQTSDLNIRISFPPGETVIVARIDSLDFHKGQLKIWDQQSLNTSLTRERIIIWSIYGMIIALVLAYMANYITSKDRSYLWASFGLVFLILFDQHYRGYYLDSLNVLGFNFTYSRFNWILSSGVLASAGFSKVMQSLYDISKLNPRFHKILDYHFMTLIFTVPIALSLDYLPAVVLISIVNVSVLPFLYYFCYWLTVTRLTPLYFNVISWIPFTMCYPLYFIQVFGLSESNLFNDTAMLWGFLYLTLSLGLNQGRKTLTLNKERTIAIINQESMKASLEVAKIVQQNLLPNRNLDGYLTYRYYKPAESVGGDSFYYDVHDRYLFMSIFDVTGHGISSAIITGTIAGAVKKAFHYEVRETTSPKILLEKITANLNETILDYNRDTKGHLVTMACGLLDTYNSTFYFLNSGHIPTYVIRPGEVKTLMSSGSPLGLRIDPIYTVKEYKIRDDDKLLFLTDGIIENLTTSGSPIRETVLIKELKSLSQQDLSSIGKSFENFLNSRFLNRSLGDDMTFFIIGKSRSSSEKNQIYEMNTAS